LEDLALFEWQSQDERFDEDVLESVGVQSSVAARNSYGGTSPDRVREQINRAKLLMRDA